MTTPNVTLDDRLLISPDSADYCHADLYRGTNWTGQKERIRRWTGIYFNAERAECFKFNEAVVADWYTGRNERSL